MNKFLIEVHADNTGTLFDMWKIKEYLIEYKPIFVKRTNGYHITEWVVQCMEEDIMFLKLKISIHSAILLSNIIT
jgi:hypothetical protein